MTAVDASSRGSIVVDAIVMDINQASQVANTVNRTPPGTFVIAERAAFVFTQKPPIPLPPSTGHSSLGLKLLGKFYKTIIWIA